MDMTERVVGNVTVLDVSGKVTLSDGTDKKLSDKLRSLVQQNRKQLVLNLGNVSYVDSAGLGAIVHSYATVKNQGGSLKLVNVTGKLRDLLSITKLLTVFDSYDNETDALKSF
jgi:anti-sigma B factor antagonist